ncbi:amino acid adenylation domain-containing protein [Micromonospora sp. CPCC 206060]|uniref:amino acid adenylation domain-containing protein n=1 Tax=Micromonospora sp. CPCC 206060 TaxID=3122406 RepID=UPI002FEF6172
MTSPRSAFSDVPSAVRHWAVTTPGRTAIVDDAGALTYGQLLRRATGIQTALARLGAGRGVTVAVVDRRGAAPLVSTLGCWLGGQVPVLVDAAQPPARIRTMLRDAGAVAVLSDTTDGSALDLPVLRPSSEPDMEAPGAGPVQGADAYIIYTSGSSGPPRGVLVGHRSLRLLVDWHLTEYDVDVRTRASSVASPGFDAFVWETWPYLSAGASVHFAPDSARLSPFELSSWYVTEKIDISFLPTPLAEAYLRYGTDLRQLRCLLTGGDQLRVAGPHELRRFVNHYGPTEATVVTTYADVPSTTAAGPAPIGRPVPSARLLVADPDTGCPTRGDVGELLIGGACLARAYWADEATTRRRFVSVDGSPGRWYRTGDLVRRDDDGDLWFVGRIDRQVKVRGVRVEPAEIESALLTHPGVADVAVEQGPTGELTAFVQSCLDGQGITLDDALRDHARTVLPDTMIPRHVVLVDSLPLTRNGKVDRAALRSFFEAAQRALPGADRAR